MNEKSEDLQRTREKQVFSHFIREILANYKMLLQKGRKVYIITKNPGWPSGRSSTRKYANIW